MNEEQPAAAASALPGVLRPRSLHHVAYVTHDATAAVDFYTRVLGMKLVSLVIDDEVPSTSDPWPYVHIFFEMEDGSTVAFFESLGLPPPSLSSHPAYLIFNHLAMDAGSKEDVDRWAERLGTHGIAFTGPVNHGIIYSIYFHDPNGLRLELTANLDASWKEHGAQAEAEMRGWQQVKEAAQLAGGDLKVVREWISARRARHKFPPVTP